MESSLSLKLSLSLLVLFTVCGYHLCEGQAGVCPVIVALPQTITVYTAVAEQYTTSCGWLMTCLRTRYRQVSQQVFTTTYSSQFGCCVGYTLTTASTCEPVCSPACLNGGVCAAPAMCNCTSQWTGGRCETPVCSEGCMNNGTCTSPDTCTCPSQWTGNTCHTDIDECASGTASCQQVCTNTPGSFSCGCAPGYSLDSNGTTCSDIDECAADTDGCDHTCTNTLGSYQCECDTGYMLRNNQRRCTDINECVSGVCQQSCTNTPGSFMCDCNTGYTLNSDGRTCTDIDECGSGTAGCQQICTNTPGSFSCGCAPGYSLDSNGTTCSDIDECARGSDNCQQICTNTPGSFLCSCREGLVLDSNGETCSVGVPPTSPPSQLTVERVNASSAQLTWAPLPHTDNIAAYQLQYQTAPSNDGDCSTIQSESGGAVTTQLVATGSEAVLSGLDPGEEYCVSVAGVTVHGVGVYTPPRRIQLYTNSLFQVLLITTEGCSTWLSRDLDNKLVDVAYSIFTVMSQSCDCSELTTNHITDERLLCNQARPHSNEVLFQGRVVGVPTASSEEMVQVIQSFAMTEGASLTVQGEMLVIEPCPANIDVELGRTECTLALDRTTPTSSIAMETDEPERHLTFPLIPVIAGASAGGVLVVVLGCVCVGVCVWRVCGRRKGRPKQQYNTRNPQSSPPADRQYSKKQLEAKEEEFYSEINEIRYNPPAGGKEMYTAIGKMDASHTYTLTPGRTAVEGGAEEQDMYMYMQSLEKKPPTTSTNGSHNDRGTIEGEQLYQELGDQEGENVYSKKQRLYQELGDQQEGENIYSLPDRGEGPWVVRDYEIPVNSGGVRVGSSTHTEGSEEYEASYI